jgi:DNA-3-methyladenine glycosylase
VAILSHKFYERQVLEVAHDLLGKRLVRRMGNLQLSGFITEVEGYDGEQDLACHAHSGRTPRTEVMYGPGGHAYIYFTYGMHWCLNCVTGPLGYPAAVLLRAILPVEGLEQIAANRAGQPQKLWCNGPAKLTRSLQIDGTLNGSNLCDPSSGILIEEGVTIPEEWIEHTPRIGIQNTPEPWHSLPWRFLAHLPDSWPLS